MAFDIFGGTVKALNYLNFESTTVVGSPTFPIAQVLKNETLRKKH